MTVEASFVVSWTVFVFVFLIYLAFYSYDKCVLFQDAYSVQHRKQNTGPDRRQWNLLFDTVRHGTHTQQKK